MYLGSVKPDPWYSPCSRSPALSRGTSGAGCASTIGRVPVATCSYVTGQPPGPGTGPVSCSVGAPSPSTVICGLPPTYSPAIPAPPANPGPGPAGVRGPGPPGGGGPRRTPRAVRPRGVVVASWRRLGPAPPPLLRD